jgi:hypothetical protein
VFRLDEKPGDRLIRVMAPFNTASGFHPMTFPFNEVQSVGEIEPGTSVIVLRAGAEIPVAVPYEEIERQIYRPNYDIDDVVLDLRAKSGDAVKVTGRILSKYPSPR